MRILGQDTDPFLREYGNADAYTFVLECRYRATSLHHSGAHQPYIKDRVQIASDCVFKYINPSICSKISDDEKYLLCQVISFGAIGMEIKLSFVSLSKYDYTGCCSFNYPTCSTYYTIQA